LTNQITSRKKILLKL